jgi:DHA1 family bicyclomycin/chloramphenicol resistance-like MFS transporter
MAMEPLGAVAGTASSVLGFYTTLAGALIGLLIGQAFDATVLPLTLGYFGLGAVCLAAVLWAEGGVLFRPHNRDPVR